MFITDVVDFALGRPPVVPTDAKQQVLRLHALRRSAQDDKCWVGLLSANIRAYAGTS